MKTDFLLPFCAVESLFDIIVYISRHYFEKREIECQVAGEL